MASRVLVSGLPRSLPPLPPGPAPTCVPCVEGRQRAAPHSSEFPPTEALLQTLHMDVWGPARVRGHGYECYFLLVVDDYSRYTTVFPLRSKGDVTEVLIDWIRAARLQPRESFGSDFPVLRLHSDRGGEFSSAHLGAFCRAQGILRSASAQPSALGLLARDLPTLRWTGKVGDASTFRDVTFDESVPYYRLFPYRTAPLPPPPLFLARGPPPVDPLPPQGPASSGVSQVDAVKPVEVAVDSGAARGAVPAGAGSGGAEPGGAESRGAESGGAESGGAVPGGAGRAARAGGTTVAAGPGGARTGGTGSAGTGGAAGGTARAAGGTARAAGGTGAVGPTGVGAAGAAGVTGAGAAGGVGASGSAGAGVSAGAGASEGARVGAVGAGGAAAWGTGAVLAGSGGAARPGAVLQSSFSVLADLESDSLRAASPTVRCLLATVVTEPSFESTAASAIVAELVDFAARCRLDYATSLVAESASVFPPSVGGECALSRDVLEDRQEEFQCFAAALPHLVSTLIAPEGDPDAPDIPTPRSYAEAIEGPYSSP
ncbi:unnamed protein product [Closterium sp. NIES-64]|nr:unnamed protein product [Closterium sp. NIES-64]